MAPMISAANVAPDFSFRRQLTTDELCRLDDPCVICEHHDRDSDGVPVFFYTVGGVLDGAPLPEGCTVGGDVMAINAEDRQTADAMASQALADTMRWIEEEAGQMVEAAVALERLREVGPVRRLELATAAPSDRSDEFEADQTAIRKLRGDDIVLAAGGVEAPLPH